MNKIPKLEINCIPAVLNTSQPTGVASQLASVAEKAPFYDGVTIDQMRGNCLYGQGDEIDKIGKAQQALADAAIIIKSRSRMIRGFNDAARKYQKPATK